MPRQYNDQAKTILFALKESGNRGLTLKQITNLIKSKKLGHDCINWIYTFLEAGIIVKINRGDIEYYIITEEGIKSLE